MLEEQLPEDAAKLGTYCEDAACFEALTTRLASPLISPSPPVTQGTSALRHTSSSPAQMAAHSSSAGSSPTFWSIGEFATTCQCHITTVRRSRRGSG